MNVVIVAINKTPSNNDMVCTYYHHSTFLLTHTHTHTHTHIYIYILPTYRKYSTEEVFLSTMQHHHKILPLTFFFSVSEDDLNGSKHFEPRESKRFKNILHCGPAFDVSLMTAGKQCSKQRDTEFNTQRAVLLALLNASLQSRWLTNNHHI